MAIAIAGILSIPGVGLAGQALTGGRAAVAPAATSQPSGAFGYELGEQRRYVLEPANSLRAGESAWWSIVLDEIQGRGDDARIIFDLEHERTEVLQDWFGGRSGRMQLVRVDGRLTVNRFGFPERLAISEQHDVHGETGSQSDLRTTLFTFENERFVKHVRINGRDWEFDIAITGHDDLDLGGPTGLYAYVPQGLRCLGAPGIPGRPSRCPGGDPAFGNPGLLSLALPAMWEERVNKKKYLFFMPSGVGTSPGSQINMGRLASRERDQQRNITFYYGRTDLEVKEFVQQVEIGPRHIDAWLLDASGEMREFYAEPGGRVLKVFLDNHPVTNGERWIRLQFPSEY